MNPAEQYSLSPIEADADAALVVVSRDIRANILKRFVDTHGEAALINLFSNMLGLANSVHRNTRDFLEIMGIKQAGLDPSSTSKLNTPTMLDAVMGTRIATGIDQGRTCEGCAFRLGTAANQSPTTTIDAISCDEAALSDHVVEYSGRQIKSIRNGVTAAVRRAKIGHVRIHDLRHTAAVTMLSAGITIEKVAQVLGHSNTVVTYSTYGRYLPEHMADAVETLDFTSNRGVR